MLTFYDAPVSGNTYKVRLLLKQLALPHEAVRLDIVGGGVRTPEVLERHLAQRRWFVGDAYSVADIALSGYTQMAPEAGHDLGKFPAVSAWLERVRGQPGWFPLE